MNRYFSHPRRGKRRMFGMNLSFLDEKVPKHKLALSVWVECKLFKEKSSKTGLKHRGCIWRIGQLSCYRPRGNRYSHTYAYAFLESFSLKSLYSAQTYGAWLTWVRKVVGNCKMIVPFQPPLSIIHLWSKNYGCRKNIVFSASVSLFRTLRLPQCAHCMHPTGSVISFILFLF